MCQRVAGVPQFPYAFSYAPVAARVLKQSDQFANL